jgi:hypothetical protein
VAVAEAESDDTRQLLPGAIGERRHASWTFTGRVVTGDEIRGTVRLPSHIGFEFLI